MHRAVFATAVATVTLVAIASPARAADAFTYSGTLAKLPIVVEFTSDPAHPAVDFAGRYFYVNKGIDIPLDSKTARTGKIELGEEAPCEPDKCKFNDDYTVSGSRIAANWSLTPSVDGKTIGGTWTFNGRSQPIALKFQGKRNVPEDKGTGPAALEAITDAFTYGDASISMESSPYDYLRMQVPLTEGPIKKQEGSTYRYVTDPRTKFPFPRIVRLAGKVDPSAANASLEQRQWQMNTDSLSCEAKQYAPFGWSEMSKYSNGTYGGYADEQVEVLSLTSHVMSWVESGSLDCGGPHPYDHREFTTIDIATGKPLDLSKILKGWIPRDFDDNPVTPEFAAANPDEVKWGPDDELVEFLMANAHNDEIDLTDPDCGYDDLFRNNLAVAFKPGDRVLFSLDGVEYAIQSCAADLYEAPIADLEGLLAPTAKDYFPALAK